MPKAADIDAFVAEEPLGRRDRKKLRTRRDLAEAAVRLFETNGYVATSVEDIAEEADYSTSTLHRHFAGKEDIVFFDFPDRLEELREAFADPGHGTAWQTIRRALTENARRWDAADGDFGVQRARLFHSEPVLHGRYLELSLEWEDVIAELVARETGQDASQVDCRLIASAAVAAFRVAWRAQVEDDGDAVTGHLQHAFDRLEPAFTD